MTPTPKSQFEWRRTNCREQHCRVDGRIVGKIMTWHGATGWESFVRSPGQRLRWIGYRRDEAAARLLVEKGL